MQLSPSFAFASGVKAGLLEAILAPASHILENYIRDVRQDGAMSDPKFLRLGVCRVLSQAASGRDFLQMLRDTMDESVARASFFDSLHQERRSHVLDQLNRELVLRNKVSMPDLLRNFPHLKGVPVFAVDGHHVEHAVHSPDDPKGEKVSANNLYLLCLHTGFMCNFGVVQGDGRHGHELPVFRNRLERQLSGYKARRGQHPPIFIGDPAFVDKVFWTRMAMTKVSARFITRTKANMKPIVYNSMAWDTTDPVNDGVEADEFVGIDGAMAMRRVRYRDPETGTRYEFLTSVDDLPPGLIALLYLARWRIEKVFDTTKNKLEETKSWAVGATAQDIRAHLVALTHNLLLLFRETLGREHGMKEEKVERKHAEQLREREEKAAASGRHVAPAQSLLPAVIQLTAQFVRAVRNGILGQLALRDVLGSLRMAMFAYL